MICLNRIKRHLDRIFLVRAGLDHDVLCAAVEQFDVVVVGGAGDVVDFADQLIHFQLDR